MEHAAETLEAKKAEQTRLSISSMFLDSKMIAFKRDNINTAVVVVIVVSKTTRWHYHAFQDSGSLKKKN